ncbi:amiloride-sensitive sodium channel subunit beta-like [Elysia marginata]|uniref:Amiloride-sensitive sodium channel subunit beta-like n=1 Tax=Elysia marginata TaxID=1093978 RepID=A0AAV4I7R7_9GAST|nr:amiloride-sensitive sodium channel subunit beta-like [Elysia marginata]
MKYAYITARLNNSFVESSGHLIKNMIASCEFNGYQCSPLNFTFFHNHKYGNCYTFNSYFSDNPKLITRFQGPGYGLKMELFLNQKEYVANLATEAGIRVLVHRRGSMPFPEDTGMTIMPGRSTSVGIKQLKFSRLPPPHGVCSNRGKITDFYNKYVGSSYSKLSCLKDFLGQKLSKTNSLYTDRDIDDHFTKIQIFYEDLIYTYIDQQEAYESMNLISDLGGQLGLWLGLSAITIGELCSLLFSVGRSLPNTWFGGSKTSPVIHSRKIALTDVMPISKIEPASLEDMYDDLCPEQAKYIPPDIIKTKSDLYNIKGSDI